MGTEPGIEETGIREPGIGKTGRRESGSFNPFLNKN